MALLAVVYNQTTKVALVQPNADPVPGGSTKVGTFDHDAVPDVLDTRISHVMWHHVRDILYLAKVENMQAVNIQVKTSLAVVSIVMTPDTVSIVKGFTSQLALAFNPAGATNKTVTFSSSNPGVATVSPTGLVTAVDGGTAIITVTTTDGNKTDTSTITVTVPVGFISLDSNAGNLSLAGVKTKQISVFFGPANATNKNVTYVSSAPAKATVSAGGLVTGVAVGSAVITVTAVDGGSTDTFTATVVA